MNKPMFKASLLVAMLPQRLTARLQEVQQELKTGGERGDGPVPTAIIIIATVTGALLIAGGLAAMYAKANGKLLGWNFGD